MSDILEFLKKMPAFQGVPDQSLRALQGLFVERPFKSGDMICQEGEFDPWLYIIAAGQCQARKKNPKTGRDITLRTLHPHEFVGLTSAFRPKPRSATVVADTDVKLYAISHDDFQRTLLDPSPHAGVLRSLFEYLANNVRKKNRQVAEFRQAQPSNGKFSVAVFDSKPYTQETFLQAGQKEFDFQFFESRLTPKTAALAEGFGAVVGFVNDDLTAESLQILRSVGVELVALRCAGFNNVDLHKAQELGLSVTRVPAYSPHAVAEHSLGLMMSLNRKIHKAYQRVRDGNFRLDGLVGFDLFGQTVGVMGTGKIGRCMVHILRGLGCKVLCYDLYPDAELQNLEGVRYCELDELLRESRVISLYLPLNRDTLHIIDQEAIEKMQDGVMLINTSRGGLVETQALINGLKSGKIGSAGLDVYEEESAYFFEDFSGKTIADDVLARLLTFNNVIVTSHQAFLTEQALVNIAETTLQSLREYFQGKKGEQLTYAVSLG